MAFGSLAVPCTCSLPGKRPLPLACWSLLVNYSLGRVSLWSQGRPLTIYFISPFPQLVFLPPLYNLSLPSLLEGGREGVLADTGHCVPAPAVALAHSESLLPSHSHSAGQLPFQPHCSEETEAHIVSSRGRPGAARSVVCA